MTKEVGKSTNVPLQYESLSQYKKYLSATYAGKKYVVNTRTSTSGEGEVKAKGLGWAIFDQIATKFLRIINKIFSGKHEWINNETVMSKIKNNVKCIDRDLAELQINPNDPGQSKLIKIHLHIHQCKHMFEHLKLSVSGRSDQSLLNEVTEGLGAIERRLLKEHSMPPRLSESPKIADKESGEGSRAKREAEEGRKPVVKAEERGPGRVVNDLDDDYSAVPIANQPAEASAASAPESAVVQKKQETVEDQAKKLVRKSDQPAIISQQKAARESFLKQSNDLRAEVRDSLGKVKESPASLSQARQSRLEKLNNIVAEKLALFEAIAKEPEGASYAELVDILKETQNMLNEIRNILNPKAEKTRDPAAAFNNDLLYDDIEEGPESTKAQIIAESEPAKHSQPAAKSSAKEKSPSAQEKSSIDIGKGKEASRRDKNQATIDRVKEGVKERRAKSAEENRNADVAQAPAPSEKRQKIKELSENIDIAAGFNKISIFREAEFTNTNSLLQFIEENELLAKKDFYVIYNLIKGTEGRRIDDRAAYNIIIEFNKAYEFEDVLPLKDDFAKTIMKAISPRSAPQVARKEERMVTAADSSGKQVGFSRAQVRNKLQGFLEKMVNHYDSKMSDFLKVRFGQPKEWLESLKKFNIDESSDKFIKASRKIVADLLKIDKEVGKGIGHLLMTEDDETIKKQLEYASKQIDRAQKQIESGGSVRETEQFQKGLLEAPAPLSAAQEKQIKSMIKDQMAELFTLVQGFDFDRNELDKAGVFDKNYEEVGLKEIYADLYMVNNLVKAANEKIDSDRENNRLQGFDGWKEEFKYIEDLIDKISINLEKLSPEQAELPPEQAEVEEELPAVHQGPEVHKALEVPEKPVSASKLGGKEDDELIGRAVSENDMELGKQLRGTRLNKDFEKGEIVIRYIHTKERYSHAKENAPYEYVRVAEPSKIGEEFIKLEISPGLTESRRRSDVYVYVRPPQVEPKESPEASKTPLEQPKVEEQAAVVHDKGPVVHKAAEIPQETVSAANQAASAGPVKPEAPETSVKPAKPAKVGMPKLVGKEDDYLLGHEISGKDIEVFAKQLEDGTSPDKDFKKGEIVIRNSHSKDRYEYARVADSSKTDEEFIKLEISPRHIVLCSRSDVYARPQQIKLEKISLPEVPKTAIPKEELIDEERELPKSEPKVEARKLGRKNIAPKKSRIAALKSTKSEVAETGKGAQKGAEAIQEAPSSSIAESTKVAEKAEKEVAEVPVSGHDFLKQVEEDSARLIQQKAQQIEKERQQTQADFLEVATRAIKLIEHHDILYDDDVDDFDNLKATLYPLTNSTPSKTFSERAESFFDALNEINLEYLPEPDSTSLNELMEQMSEQMPKLKNFVEPEKKPVEVAKPVTPEAEPLQVTVGPETETHKEVGTKINEGFRLIFEKAIDFATNKKILKSLPSTDLKMIKDTSSEFYRGNAESVLNRFIENTVISAARENLNEKDLKAWTRLNESMKKQLGRIKAHEAVDPKELELSPKQPEKEGTPSAEANLSIESQASKKLEAPVEAAVGVQEAGKLPEKRTITNEELRDYIEEAFKFAVKNRVLQGKDADLEIRKLDVNDPNFNRAARKAMDAFEQRFNSIRTKLVMTKDVYVKFVGFIDGMKKKFGINPEREKEIRKVIKDGIKELVSTALAKNNSGANVDKFLEWGERAKLNELAEADYDLMTPEEIGKNLTDINGLLTNIGSRMPPNEELSNTLIDIANIVQENIDELAGGEEV